MLQSSYFPRNKTNDNIVYCIDFPIINKVYTIYTDRILYENLILRGLLLQFIYTDFTIHLHSGFMFTFRLVSHDLFAKLLYNCCIM